MSASTNTASSMVLDTELVVDAGVESSPSEDPRQPEQLVLRLRPAAQQKTTTTRRVTFTAETVDNEHLGRLKSNCCCIYVKPRVWDGQLHFQVFA
jgi:protein phosphatase 1 regulatory subunit 11